jgi:hypothetical protein
MMEKLPLNGPMNPKFLDNREGTKEGKSYVLWPYQPTRR